MRTMTKRLIVIDIALGLAAGGAGIAYALWKTSGTTSLNAETATINPLSAVAKVEGTLMPGGHVEAVISISNVDNTVAVKLLSVEAESIEVDQAHQDAGCQATNYGFVPPTAETLPVLAATHWWTAPVFKWEATVTGQVTLSHDSPLACQGSVITLHLKATGEATDDPATA